MGVNVQGRGAGLGRGLGVGPSLGVGIGVGVTVGVGVGAGVGVEVAFLVATGLWPVHHRSARRTAHRAVATAAMAFKSPMVTPLVIMLRCGTPCLAYRAALHEQMRYD